MVNGRRFVYGGVGGDTSADLNMIPSSMLERVEVMGFHPGEEGVLAECRTKVVAHLLPPSGGPAAAPIRRSIS